MLERYFVRPTTVDRLRALWLGPVIERHAEHLDGLRYSAHTVAKHVHMLVQFGEFARRRGAQSVEDLPQHVPLFVKHWVRGHTHRPKTVKALRQLRSKARSPVEQMLRLVLPGFAGTTRRRTVVPFKDQAPGFFDYLREERGLKADALYQYAHHLAALEKHLGRAQVSDLARLSPRVLTAFFVASARRLGAHSMQHRRGCVRGFLRYLYREGVTPQDLSLTVERGRQYRQAGIPRSIDWSQVGKILGSIDRRAPVGKRDYAILLLLVTYGLRAREVAALTLDDIDWEHERLHVPRRKGGHATTYPLSLSVGEAILDYLRSARPETSDRHVFIRALPPYVPLPFHAVSDRASLYLRRAGVSVPRPGSHTFRYTCVQRLVDGDFSFKLIGDYVGHRSPESTQIYGKVAVEALREMVLGGAEEIL